MNQMPENSQIVSHGARCQQIFVESAKVDFYIILRTLTITTKNTKSILFIKNN
jgi:hypothetical protein